MEEFVNIVINNGIGVGSFIAFIYFINKYLVKMNDVLTDVSATLKLVQSNLTDLTSRVNDIENRLDN